MSLVGLILVGWIQHCMSFNIQSFSNFLQGKKYLFSKTEIWSLDENDESVNMKNAEPSLTYYGVYPELFIVDSDFCTKK